jgi:hypothetical protein
MAPSLVDLCRHALMKVGRHNDIWKSDHVTDLLKEYHRDKYWDHVYLVQAMAERMYGEGRIKVGPDGKDAWDLRLRIWRGDYDQAEYEIVRKELANLGIV